MASTTIAADATGNTGALSADTIFWVEKGEVLLTSDGGTPYIPFSENVKVQFSSGLTIGWLNRRPTEAILTYMSL